MTNLLEADTSKHLVLRGQLRMYMRIPKDLLGSDCVLDILVEDGRVRNRKIIVQCRVFTKARRLEWTDPAQKRTIEFDS